MKKKILLITFSVFLMVSSGASTVVEDFEDGNINEFFGDIQDFVVQSSIKYEGNYAIERNTSGTAERMIYRNGTNWTVNSGEKYSAWVYDYADPDSSYVAIGVSNDNKEGYFARLAAQGGNFEIRTRPGGTQLASTSVSVSEASWYKIIFYHYDNGSIKASIYDSGLNKLGSVSAVDSTYSSTDNAAIQSPRKAYIDKLVLNNQPKNNLRIKNENPSGGEVKVRLLQDDSPIDVNLSYKAVSYNSQYVKWANTSFSGKQVSSNFNVSNNTVVSTVVENLSVGTKYYWQPNISDEAKFKSLNLSFTTGYTNRFYHDYSWNLKVNPVAGPTSKSYKKVNFRNPSIIERSECSDEMSSLSHPYYAYFSSRNTNGQFSISAYYSSNLTAWSSFANQPEIGPVSKYREVQFLDCNNGKAFLTVHGNSGNASLYSVSNLDNPSMNYVKTLMTSSLAKEDRQALMAFINYSEMFGHPVTYNGSQYRYLGCYEQNTHGETGPAESNFVFFKNVSSSMQPVKYKGESPVQERLNYFDSSIAACGSMTKSSNGNLKIYYGADNATNGGLSYYRSYSGVWNNTAPFNEIDRNVKTTYASNKSLYWNDQDAAFPAEILQDQGAHMLFVSTDDDDYTALLTYIENNKLHDLPSDSVDYSISSSGNVKVKSYLNTKSVPVDLNLNTTKDINVTLNNYNSSKKINIGKFTVSAPAGTSINISGDTNISSGHTNISTGTWSEKISTNATGGFNLTYGDNADESFSTKTFTVGSTSSSDSTLSIKTTGFDGFEDNDITEYSGDTGAWTTQSSKVFNGSYSANATVTGTNSVIYRSDTGWSMNSSTNLSAMVYLPAGDGNSFTGPAMVKNASAHYHAWITERNGGEFALEKNDGGTFTQLTLKSVSLSTNTWYQVKINRNFTSGNISVWLFSSSGNLLSKIKAKDNSISGANKSGIRAYSASYVDDLKATYTHESTDTSPPSLTLHSPSNSTISDTSPWLNVTSNEAVQTWEYSLDGGSNVSFTPNTTLSSLSDGGHQLDVYATDSSGNTGSSSVQFTVDTSGVDNAPTVNLSLNASTINENESVEATVSASDDLQVDSVALDWTGDGTYEESSTGSSLTATRQFNSTGTYTITARATDNNSQTSTDSVSLEVDPVITATNKSVIPTCTNANSNDAFCVENSTNSVTIQNGMTSGESRTVSFNVSARVSSGEYRFFGFANSTGQHNELVESAKHNITVVDHTTQQNQAPFADFSITPTSPVAGESITFDASGSSDSDGSISAYRWDWTGDGTFDSTGKTTSHTYPSSGDYSVKLQVEDNDGATSTLTSTITVASNDTSSGGGGSGGGTGGDTNTTTGGTASLGNSKAQLLQPHLGARYGASYASVQEGNSTTILVSSREVTIQTNTISGTDSAEVTIGATTYSVKEGERITVKDVADIYISDIVNSPQKKYVTFSESVFTDFSVPVLNPNAAFAYNYSVESNVSVAVQYREIKDGVAQPWQNLSKTQYNSTTSGIKELRLQKENSGVFEARLLIYNSTNSTTTNTVGFYMGNVPAVDILRPENNLVIPKPMGNTKMSLPLDFRFENNDNVSVNASTYYIGPSGERYVGNLEGTKIISSDQQGIGKSLIRYTINNVILLGPWVKLLEYNPTTTLIQNSTVPVNATEGDYHGYVNVSSNEGGFNASSFPVTVTVNKYNTFNDSQLKEYAGKRDKDRDYSVATSNKTNVTIGSNSSTRYYQSQLIMFEPDPGETITGKLDQIQVDLKFDFIINATGPVNRSLIVTSPNATNKRINLSTARSQYRVELNASDYGGSWSEGNYSVKGEVYYRNGSVMDTVENESYSFTINKKTQNLKNLFSRWFSPVVEGVTTVYDFGRDHVRFWIALIMTGGGFIGFKARKQHFIANIWAIGGFIFFSWYGFIPGSIQAMAVTLASFWIVIRFWRGEYSI